MALSCPRCDVPLSSIRAASHAGGAPVELDVCDRCQGLWIDGGELAAVCPTVAHLPERRTEVCLLGQKGAGIQRCPRCGQVPYELVVLEVAVDFCAGCAGVWFDGDEYGEIPFEGASTVDARRAGPYRAAALDAARSGEVTCAYCSTKAPIKETFMWEKGLVCRSCHAARSQARVGEAPSPYPTGNIAEAFLTLLKDACDWIVRGRNPF